MVRATKTSKTSVTQESSSVQDTSFADAAPANNNTSATAPSSPQSKNKVVSPNKKRKRASESLEGSSGVSRSAGDKKRKVKEEDGEGLDVDRDESGSEPGEEGVVEENGPFLSSHHARSALEVLEALDPAGLLDVESTVKGVTSTLRKLLKAPSPISLRMVRDRVRHEMPVVDSRTRPAKPDVVQFFSLAQTLLDDIAENTSAGKFLVDSAVPSKQLNDELDEDTKPIPIKPEEPSPPRGKHVRYALHQHLPTGDYFTSATALTKKEISSLTKGQASLTAVLPSVPIPSSSLPKLGDYAPGPSNHTRRPYPLRKAPIPISSASFLDYGPFASLAPAFDSDGGQIGRDTLGLVLDMKRSKKARRLEAVRKQIELARLREKPITSIEPFPSVEESLFKLDLNNDSRHTTGAVDWSNTEEMVELTRLGKEILPENMVEDFLVILDQLKMEKGVEELLVRNSKALRDLQVLQERRFRAGAPGKEVLVEVGGEEWHLARQILSSLTTIASFQPRAPSSTSSLQSLIPPSNVLHRIHQTLLPRDPIPGYKGTLFPNRDYALIDNTTIRSSALPVPPPVTGSLSNATQTLPPPPATMPGGLPPAAANRSAAPIPYSYHRPTATPKTPQAPYTPGGATMSYYRQGYQMHQGYYPPQYSQGGYYGYAGYAGTPGGGVAHYTPPPNATTSGAAGRALPNLATKPLTGWGYTPGSPVPPGGAGANTMTTGTGGVVPNAAALPVHLRRLNGTGTSGSPTPGTPGSPAPGGNT